MANVDINNSFRELRNGKKIPIRRKDLDLKKRRKAEQAALISDEIEETHEDSDNLNEEPEEKDDSENADEESDSNDCNKGYYADVTNELNKMKNDLSYEKSSDVQNINLRKSDTKPSSGNCAKCAIWISILFAIVGFLAVYLNNKPIANLNNKSDKLVLWKQAFTNLLHKYGDALPEISQKVINKSVQSVLQRQFPSEKFNNCEPAVILLLGSKDNMPAVKCIFLELSRSVANIFGEKQSPVLNAEKMTRIDLDNQFHDILGHQSLHSIALDGIERLKGDEPLSLHPFTDHDKAPYLDVIIILTAYSDYPLITNSSLQIQQIDSIANNILELSWGQSLPAEQVAGLLSRITPSVAIISDTNQSQNWHCE